MALMNGGKAVVEVLKTHGVDTVFGIISTHTMYIYDALYNETKNIRFVGGRHEHGVGSMADAYARATGTPSFVNLHIETGLANGISLLHNANSGGTPLVLTAGNKDMRELAHGRTDLSAMVRQFTKWSVEVTHPEAIPVVIQRAFNINLFRSG